MPTESEKSKKCAAAENGEKTPKRQSGATDHTSEETEHTTISVGGVEREGDLAAEAGGEAQGVAEVVRSGIGLLGRPARDVAQRDAEVWIDRRVGRQRRDGEVGRRKQSAGQRVLDADAHRVAREGFGVDDDEGAEIFGVEVDLERVDFVRRTRRRRRRVRASFVREIRPVARDGAARDAVDRLELSKKRAELSGDVFAVHRGAVVAEFEKRAATTRHRVFLRSRPAADGTMLLVGE
eukprot:CAMPEP_0185706264 /NCGR_PEP_ID=MMETSP1164-20130828/21613_1 /TAXON_ID=1104430 /ORGANISM="Chrysoreinhardia sp, Strain CCMP2950" /LENGTH=236 /DNA_ID=CAMNT_0028373667 /DNA_START=66 /DNA_END=778 /DNA_ORIENTATION=+